MPFWSKSKSFNDKDSGKLHHLDSEDQPLPPKFKAGSITTEQIADAILTLREPGDNFYFSYARMNGYNEKQNNLSRRAELIMATNAEPNFTEEGIEFAVQCELEELDAIAARPEGIKFPNLTHASPQIQKWAQEEKDKQWARDLLGNLGRWGNVSLRSAFEELGFDFKKFLVDTAVQRRDADLQIIFSEIERRKSALKPLFLRAYSQGRNKYGEIELDHLYDEIQDFYRTFFPKGTLKFYSSYPPLSIVAELALNWIESAASNEAKPADGIDFEHWCARKIEEQGWLVTVSKASGDQGVDVVASKDSISVVVQCKRYSTPIGNKAVQEAFTGARHYNADLAVVIGTGGFTKSAHELALSTDVLLLDAEMIGDFSDQVFNKMSHIS